MDKALLFEDIANEEEVELAPLLDGTRRVVRIRGLSKAELHAMTKRQDWKDPQKAEQIMLATALVDPEIDVNDAKLWQEKDNRGDIGRVLDLIGTISGMKDGADKEAYKSFPGESGS